MAARKQTAVHEEKKLMRCLSGIGADHVFMTTPERRVCPKCVPEFMRRLADISPRAITGMRVIGRGER